VPAEKIDKQSIPWRELDYVIYAREFGWTPDQVDNLPLAIEPWILPIHGVIEDDITRRHNETVEKAKAGK
jgi:hypothetical protein